MIFSPAVAAVQALDLLTDSWDTWYHLYTNPVVMNSALLKADFIEASWTDYRPLRMAYWSPAIWRKVAAFSWGEQLRWVSPGTIPGVRVEGYFVTNGETGPLLFCERSSRGPIDMASPGNEVNLYPEYSLQGC